ncbi:class I ribonucleotide reductase maintenance protein YfaE [Shewanella sp. Isolate11]|uniref:class I ribonucleotide reductase maintenance protein YfaE n=1 Tax=Shewanella sp. Isolate11 TaxID=2908530 RepID=UPI001EFE4A71|nr:class I ribonucleotide reductase maintenance protein YfaE [Shewanella sp. Isolate11]MCG9696713.1 class I ribonucleotide reductase maintenance protein YfaE [Shewanella sp. Isolate11]
MKVSSQTLTCKAPFNKAPIVSLEGQPVLLYTTEHQSLLQALEQKQVKIFSECRNGFCGACKTKINRGSVTYHTEPLVELEQDECLPCCCHPQSDIDLDLSPKGADIIESKHSIQYREKLQQYQVEEV